jgi:hypothetical protein
MIGRVASSWVSLVSKQGLVWDLVVVDSFAPASEVDRHPNTAYTHFTLLLN